MLGLTAEEQQALLRSVGTHRKDRRLSPLDVAELLQKTIKSGTTRKDCGRQLQLGMTQITSFLNLLKLSPEIRHLADWSATSNSTISFSSLALLAGLNDPTDQVVAARAILANRLSWREVVQVVQLKNRSKTQIEENVNAILKLRPRVITRHVIVGSIVSESLRDALRRLDQNRRDELLKRALQPVLGSTAHFDCRLGTNNFTIVGTRDPVQVGGMSADDLETSVNDALTREVSE